MILDKPAIKSTPCIKIEKCLIIRKVGSLRPCFVHEAMKEV